VTPRQVGLLGALGALWGGSYLLIKYALVDFSAPFVVFGRTALGALVLLAVIRWQGGASLTALRGQRGRPWLALGLGAVAITAPFLLITLGELEVPSGLTAVLIATAPLFVAMLAPFVDRTETISRRQGVGLLIGFGGVVLLVGVESVSSAGELLGAIAVVGAAACYAISSFVVKGPYRGVPSVVVSFLSVGAGAVLTVPAVLATLPDHVPGWRSVVSLVVLGAGGTALAFVIFYRLIAEVGAGRATLVSYLAPGLALLYGAVLLDERITLAGAGGIALILAGVFVASRGGVSRPESA